MFPILPAQTEVLFEPTKYVELFRGDYSDAKPLLEKLEESHLSPGLWKLSVEKRPGEPTVVVISVAEPIEMEARHVLDPSVEVPPFRPKDFTEFPQERRS